VPLASEQVFHVEMNKKDKTTNKHQQSSDSETHQPRARRPNLIHQSALTEQTRIQSPRTPARNREIRPRFTRQDAQMYRCEEDEKEADSGSLLAMTYEGTAHGGEKPMEKLDSMASTLKLH
jgi:hypothetical protein